MWPKVWQHTSASKRQRPVRAGVCCGGAQPRSAQAAAVGVSVGLLGGPALDYDMAGFAMKVAALILSQFEEVRSVLAGQQQGAQRLCRCLHGAAATKREANVARRCC